MRLFILRHGKAAKREDWDGDDADRPLTRSGVAHAGRMVAAIRPFITASEILTSPWTRARQTAEIASGSWTLPLREAPWLAGGAATPAQLAAQLAPRTDVVLVGHEPDLGELVRFLSGGRVVLKKCGFAVLDGEPGERGMGIIALLPPRLVEDLEG